MSRKSKTSWPTSVPSTTDLPQRQRGRALALLLLAATVVTLPLAIWISRAGDDDPLRAWSSAPAELRPILWPEARPVADFTLHDQRGEAFTRDDFVGRWNLVFFGYLECPDVCPTTLHALREMRTQLVQAQRGAAEDYRFVFVSVDPGRDTPARMAPYLAHFDDAFVGLSGDAAELDRLARSMAIKYVEIVDEASGVRAIDHTSSVLVIDPLGRVTAALPPPHRPERMLEQMHQLRRYTRL